MKKRTEKQVSKLELTKFRSLKSRKTTIQKNQRTTVRIQSSLMTETRKEIKNESIQTSSSTTWPKSLKMMKTMARKDKTIRKLTNTMTNSLLRKIFTTWIKLKKEPNIWMKLRSRSSWISNNEEMKVKKLMTVKKICMTMR